MARPDKKGLDYYPKDIDADRDDKLSMIIGEFGYRGELLFDKICGAIYKNNGYYIEWNEQEQLKFLSRYNYCGFSVSFINEVVPRLIKWGLFDKSVFDSFHILTSIRIQKTWVDASRKRTGRTIDKRFWLIEVSGGIQAEETPKKAEETTQSKVKESKVKEIIIPPAETKNNSPDFFYIGRELFKMKPSRYLELNCQIFLDERKIIYKNKFSEILKELDKTKNSGYQFNGINHLKNSFDKIGKDGNKTTFSNQKNEGNKIGFKVNRD